MFVGLIEIVSTPKFKQSRKDRFKSQRAAYSLTKGGLNNKYTLTPKPWECILSTADWNPSQLKPLLIKFFRMNSLLDSRPIANSKCLRLPLPVFSEDFKTSL